MKHLKTLTVLTIIISIIALTACTGGASPSTVIKKSYDLMKVKDFETLSKLYVKDDGTKLSDDEYKKIEGLAGMGYKEYEKKGGIKTVIIDEEKIAEDGKSARVKFTINYGNDKTNRENAKLIKVDGKWLIIFAMN